MQVSVIRQEAQRLKAKYHTDNPYDICREMRIRVIRTSMGTQPESCKGFFVIKNRCKVIALNCDLPENIQRIILVHELAHANLHSGTAISAFHEFQFFDNANIMEYEANVFAAEFLLSDEDVLDALTKVINDPQYRTEAERIAGSFKASGGIAEAKAFIEEAAR